MRKVLCLRYKPESPFTWISNALVSLQSIVTEYHLDGIDIDYETFPTNNDTSFAHCIGELITRLKQQDVITVASIAPYYRTVDPYVDLFQKYGDVIDYVNHQFYTDKVKYPAYYLQDFRLRASQFSASKLLPSYEVDGRGIQGDAFFEALELIKSRGLDVNGVMIFSADASQKHNFYFERKSQAFLRNSTVNGSEVERETIRGFV